MSFCDRCNRVLFGGRACPCDEFRVWRPEIETIDDSVAEYAFDQEEAAEVFAQHMCDNDPDYYSIFISDGLNVCVKRASAQSVVLVHVEAEETVTFTGRARS